MSGLQKQRADTVHGPVEAVVGLKGVGEAGGHRLDVGGVEGKGLRLEFVAEGIQGLSVTTGEYEAGAVSGETPTGRRADASRGAEDDVDGARHEAAATAGAVASTPLVSTEDRMPS